jgi:DNA segregation ATPase FtsK/SpoIIIE, S-DNA-T family
LLKSTDEPETTFMRTLSHRSSHVLPDHIGSALRKRLTELGGLCLIALTAVMVAALATWSSVDPSYNNAIDGAAKNLLGRPGAIAADFLMQWFGIAAMAVLLPLAVWGWQILTHRHTSHVKTRLTCWIAGGALACRYRRPGRCKRVWAASSAIRC